MSLPIRVLIADDETSARRRLMQFLSEESDIELVAECRDGEETCRQIASMAPDLIFLDVEMPELDGLGVARRIGVENMPVTIFVTAYDHYALSAFNANAMDYLLKPFDGERFAMAMEKARRWVRMGQLAECKAQLDSMLVTVENEKKFPNRLLVRTGDSQLFIKVADILYISAEGNYICLHTLSGEHLMRERMQGILERLDPARFRRIHRSHIVNLDHIKKSMVWFGGDHLITMADGRRLTLSRNYKTVLQELC